MPDWRSWENLYMISKKSSIFLHFGKKSLKNLLEQKHTCFGTSIDIIFKLVYALLAMQLAILAIWISYIIYSFFSFYNFVLSYFSFVSDVYWLDRPDSTIFKWYFAEIVLFKGWRKCKSMEITSVKYGPDLKCLEYLRSMK